MAISQILIKIIVFHLCHFEHIDAEIDCHPLESEVNKAIYKICNYLSEPIIFRK